MAIAERLSTARAEPPHLGKIRDAKKGWRAQAVFTRDELEGLISDPRIPQDRRVLNALGRPRLPAPW